MLTYKNAADVVNLHTPKILFDGERPEWARE